LGHRICPLPEGPGRLHAIEGAVDLKRIEPRGRKAQLPLLHQSRRIEIPPPRPIGPSRNPDPDLSHTSPPCAHNASNPPGFTHPHPASPFRGRSLLSFLGRIAPHPQCRPSPFRGRLGGGAR